jgi:hypothetical protein
MGAGRMKTVGWAKPTGPAFGRPHDRLRVPTGRVGTAREASRPIRIVPRAFTHPTGYWMYEA